MHVAPIFIRGRDLMGDLARDLTGDLVEGLVVPVVDLA